MFSHKLKAKRQYIKAYKDKELSKEVIDILKNPARPSLKKISEESNINYETIRYWARKLKKDAEYMPGKSIGVHRRIFSAQEEEAIADMIREQFIQHHIIMKRKHLRRLLIMSWKSLDPLNREDIQVKKTFSYQFLKDFCKRNGLSFRQMRKKKRSIINDKEVEEYTTCLFQAFQKFGPDLIGNMDETPWNFVFKRGQILSIRGKEEVDGQLPDDYRKSFTVISTISASGMKYPPIFLAQGTSNLCHKQFKDMESDPNDYEIYHSSGGNTDDEVMEFYLHCFSKWMNEKPCALVLDRYASHVSENTKAVANNLGITLIYIPTSATDVYQPLDKRIFGIMKSMASSQYDDKVFDQNQAYSKSEAADLFISLWKKLSHHSILSAWEESSDSSDSESSSSSFYDEEDTQ